MATYVQIVSDGSETISYPIEQALTCVIFAPFFLQRVYLTRRQFHCWRQIKFEEEDGGNLDEALAASAWRRVWAASMKNLASRQWRLRVLRSRHWYRQGYRC